jgi:hypothetical protein
MLMLSVQYQLVGLDRLFVEPLFFLVLGLVLDSVKVFYFESVTISAMILTEYGIKYRHHQKPVAAIRSTGKHFVTLPANHRVC